MKRFSLRPRRRFALRSLALASLMWLGTGIQASPGPFQPTEAEAASSGRSTAAYVYDRAGLQLRDSDAPHLDQLNYSFALIQNGESYDMELELPAFAFAPISEGDRAGRAVACSDGQEIASVRIVYSEDVEVDRELKLTPGERFLRFWVLTGLSSPFYLE